MISTDFLHTFTLLKLVGSEIITAIFLEWDSKQEDQTDVNVWEDNWDDDAIGNFSIFYPSS